MVDLIPAAAFWDEGGHLLQIVAYLEGVTIDKAGDLWGVQRLAGGSDHIQEWTDAVVTLSVRKHPPEELLVYAHQAGGEGIRPGRIDLARSDALHSSDHIQEVAFALLGDQLRQSFRVGAAARQ